MAPRMLDFRPSRRDAVTLLALGGAGVAASAFAQEKPELSTLRFANSVDASSFLPAYVAAARTWKEQGLNVEFSNFRSDAEAAQALAGGSVDVTLQSFDGLLTLISSGQPAVGFYAGFAQADFEWFAIAKVRSWADLRGQSVGVSSFGSLTDQLTRHALRKHGLDPEKEVTIQQIGPSSAALQAMKSGRLAAGVLSAPFKWTAAEAGLTQLAVQKQEISPTWPKHTFIAKRAFLDNNPKTIHALLRAHVAAIKLARADKPFTVKVLQDRLKYTAENASRAYDDVIADFDERGEIPDMKTFWRIKKDAGEYPDVWPREKYFDDRYLKTYAQWAP